MQPINKNNDLNLQFFIKLLLVYLVTTALIVISLITFFKSFPIEDISPQALTCLPQALRIYDRNDQLLTTASGEQNRIFISVDDLSHHTKMAFVAAEDARFYAHNGIDIKRILSAALSDIKAGYYKEGASTITQQLIKNSHLTSDKKLSRKIREIILSLQLESRYKKDEIMEMYLNYIYFGNGCYGIEVAAQKYYNKNASDLTIAESASLAGIVKSPTNYSPYTNYEAFIKRRNTVLDLMLKYGHITKDEHSKALSEKVNLSSKSRNDNSYGYIVDQILIEASGRLNITIDELLNGGFHIYTTVDQELTEIARSVISNDQFFPSDTAQCAVVMLDSKTGAVLSLIGGREYSVRMGFNRATMARRSPGSTIKPIVVYAPAIEQRMITAATVINDQKKSFGNYTPENFNSKYYGNVTVRDALIRSLNIPAVEILSSIGVETGKKYAGAMGVDFDMRDTGLSLALGGMTKGISPLQLASCYQSLANMGTHCDSYFINRICNSQDVEVFVEKQKTQSVYSEDTAFIVNDILKDASKKSGSPFSSLPFQICVKTGTASYKGLGNSDIWVAAYNSEYTIVVWQGYDHTSDQSLIPQNVTGNKYPSMIASSILGAIYKNGDHPESYPVPKGIIQAELDKDSLKSGKVLLSTQYTPSTSTTKEYFINGTEPQEYSEYYNLPRACDVAVHLANTFPIVTIEALNDYTYYDLYKIMDGDHHFLYRFSGKENSALSYCDTEAYGSVKYYVIPEHMYVTDLDGSPLIGKAGKLISVNIPKPSIGPPDIQSIPTTETPVSPEH